MKISRHYNKIVKVERLATTTGFKKSHVEIISNLKCHIQPLSDDLLGSDGIFGKDFQMFTDFVDIQEQDRVIDANGYEYRVNGVEKFEFRGKLRHIEVLLRINDQPDK